jgi:hypothetical protein
LKPKVDGEEGARDGKRERERENTYNT